MEDNSELLLFFKALSDANRLKIVGLLAQHPHTVEQLSQILGLGASTVSHHLAKLSDAGLVSARAQSYYNYYRLENERLEAMGRRLISKEGLPGMPDLPEKTIIQSGEFQMEGYFPDAYDRKVLHNYLLLNGRLKNIPSQHKKLSAVLRYLSHAFKPGVLYSEREVNEILSRYHADTATLRRELVGARLMNREGGGGNYWRVEKDETHNQKG